MFSVYLFINALENSFIKEMEKLYSTSSLIKSTFTIITQIHNTLKTFFIYA